MINCTPSYQALLCIWDQRDSINNESIINSCFDGVRETDNTKNMKAVAKAIFLDADVLTKTQWREALGFECLIEKFERLHAKESFEMKEGFTVIETCFSSLKENPKFKSLIGIINGAFIVDYFKKPQNSDSQ